MAGKKYKGRQVRLAERLDPTPSERRAQSLKHYFLIKERINYLTAAVFGEDADSSLRWSKDGDLPVLDFGESDWFSVLSLEGGDGTQGHAMQEIFFVVANSVPGVYVDFRNEHTAFWVAE